MKQRNGYTEAARTLPVAAEVDVVVVGGGSAGVGASVRAAREGARTLLIESSAILGGMWTKAMQSHATCFHDGEKVIVNGVAHEIMSRLHALGVGEDPEEKFRQSPDSVAANFEAEWMKCVLDDIVVESGARILFHTMCVGIVPTEGDGIGGVIIENKSGRQVVRAKTVIDCSGDADVAHLAGARYLMGREKDGQCQPVNTVLQLGNVDRKRANAFVEANPGILSRLSEEAAKRGEITGEYRINRLGALTAYPDVVYVNMGHIFGVDITNAASLSNAEIEGRRQVREIYRFFRKYVPGFEECRMLHVAQCTGLRESRRIIGVHTITVDDVLEGRRFPDGIARHWYRLDVHSADGLKPELGVDPWAKPPKGQYYEVPYRCLVPEKVDNLLVAGRCISADRLALGSCRTTVCCVELGEAAGLAAAIAARTDTKVRDLDGAELKRRLFPS
jgi:ribulose 1,5-bisphosphate synthetase/thiazole synthase